MVIAHPEKSRDPKSQDNQDLNPHTLHIMLHKKQLICLAANENHISGTTKSAKIGAKKSPVPPHAQKHPPSVWLKGWHRWPRTGRTHQPYANGSHGLGGPFNTKHKRIMSDSADFDWLLMGFFHGSWCLLVNFFCQFSKTAWLYHSGWWYTYPSEKWWSSSLGMMKFPIWWESHKIPWFPTINQRLLTIINHILTIY